MLLQARQHYGKDSLEEQGYLGFPKHTLEKQKNKHFPT